MKLKDLIIEKIRSFRGKVSKHHIYSFKLFIFTRIILQIVGIVSRKIPTHLYINIDITGIYWLDFWAAWDGARFMEIALNGYQWNNNLDSYAFFPLYPLLIKILSFQSKTMALISGVLISNIALYCSSILLYKIVLLDYDELHARRAMKFLYLFPYSMILSGVYSESLFLFFILLTVYYAKKGNWLKSGAFGYLAALTKITGVFIMLYLIYEYLHQIEYDLAKIKVSILSLGIPMFGLVSYMYYNYIYTGSFLTFLIVQNNWGRIYRNPFASLVEGLFIFDLPYRILTSWVMLIILLLLSINFKKLGYANLVWSMFMIVIPMSTAWIVGWTSLPRQILPIFPIYMVGAIVTTNKKFETALTLICFGSLIVIMFIWASGISIVV